VGASRALADHLVRHPGDWRELRGADAARPPDAEELRAGLLAVVGADPYSPAPVADVSRRDAAEAAHALRLAYRRRVLRLAGRDLTGVQDLKEVAAELADLAAAVLEGALALARARFPEEAERCRLAVIGLGKCGGRELNYVSDVDVVFVAEPTEACPDEAAALAAATRLASALLEVPTATDAEGTLWEVDTALRPDGRNGPLVRSLGGHVSYYERWAKTWEFQALVKARPIAGDAELGAAYMKAISPLVWQAAGRPNFVEDVQAMRRRVEAHLPRAQADREVKLGRAGSAISSLRCSCCNWCTGGGTSRCVRGTRWRRWRRCPRAGMWAARMRRRWRMRTAFCGGWSICSSCTGCAAPICCRTRSPTRASGRCVGWAALWGSPRIRWGAWWTRGGGGPRRCAGCTRSCSTGRC